MLAVDPPGVKDPPRVVADRYDLRINVRIMLRVDHEANPFARPQKTGRYKPYRPNAPKHEVKEDLARDASAHVLDS